jgi:hypothetical protein
MKGKVSKRDGRLNISVNETKNRAYLAKALGATFLKYLGPAGEMKCVTPGIKKGEKETEP